MSDPSLLSHASQDQIVAFAQGSMPAAERSVLQVHLAQCPSCRKALASLPGDSLELLYGSLADPAGHLWGDQPTLNQVSAVPATTTPPPTPYQGETLDFSVKAQPENNRIALDSPFGIELPDLKLLEILGRGGMGVVYKARQLSLDRFVAVKMLVPQHRQNPQSLARFQAESRAAAGLAHPNIVAIHQVGQCPLGQYFVMEYIEGKSLQSVLDRQGPGRQISISWALNLLIPVSEAVHYAHSRGIIHRDLKPDNIMIDKFKRPVVTDFGLAKVTGSSLRLTGPGVAMGTPAYMPPEQAGDQQAEIGPFSDVYALGAILYRLLAGRPVFEAEGTIEMLNLVLSAAMPPSPRKYRPKVPQALNRIVMKCLKKRPEQRYASAGTLAQELREFRSTLPNPDKPPSSPDM